jgi:hypothetical protein
VAGQQIDHHAFVGRIEMLDKDKSHAYVGWQRVNELATGIKTTRRGAYSDDREVATAARLAARHRGTPARFWTYRFSLTRTGPWHCTASHASTWPSTHSTVFKVSPRATWTFGLSGATQIALDGHHEAIVRLTSKKTGLLYNIAHSQTGTRSLLRRKMRSDRVMVPPESLYLHSPKCRGKSLLGLHI